MVIQCLELWGLKRDLSVVRNQPCCRSSKITDFHCDFPILKTCTCCYVDSPWPSYLVPIRCVETAVVVMKIQKIRFRCPQKPQIKISRVMVVAFLNILNVGILKALLYVTKRRLVSKLLSINHLLGIEFFRHLLHPWVQK